MKLSDQPTEFNQARFQFAERLVGQVFGDSAFLTPLQFAEKALGWAPSTSYKYSAGINGRQFPVRLQKVGSTQMVSALDYLDYLLAGGSSGGSSISAEPPKLQKKRGRRSNEERARLAAEQTSSSSH